MIVTLGLTGWSFEKSETQGDKIERTAVVAAHAATRLTGVVSKQAADRENSTVKNVEARRQDCANGNQVREGLRTGVLQGEKELPLILRLLPSLNTKQVLDLSHKETKRQLKDFRPVDCEAYALRALPPAEANKVTLREQQAQIKQLVNENHSATLSSAKSREVTVKQRCDLTRFVLEGATLKAKVRVELQHSLAGCEQQLVKVEHEAKALGG